MDEYVEARESYFRDIENNESKIDYRLGKLLKLYSLKASVKPDDRDTTYFLTLSRVIKNHEQEITRCNDSKSHLLRMIDYTNEEIIKELCFDGDDDE